MADNSFNVVRESEFKTLRDYIVLARTNFIKILLITATITAGSILYAVRTPDIYTATTTLKISPPQGNILEAPLIPSLSWNFDF